MYLTLVTTNVNVPMKCVFSFHYRILNKNLLLLYVFHSLHAICCFHILDLYILWNTSKQNAFNMCEQLDRSVLKSLNPEQSKLKAGKKNLLGQHGQNSNFSFGPKSLSKLWPWSDRDCCNEGRGWPLPEKSGSSKPLMQIQMGWYRLVECFHLKPFQPHLKKVL